MKIIYCADIRGEFARLYTLLKETIADAYIVAGNLLDMPFYTEERFDRFRELQESFMARMKGNEDFMNAEEYASSLLNDAGEDEQTRADARELIDLSCNAVQSMMKKYVRLETILGTKPFVPILVLPGASDLHLDKTALAGRSVDSRIFKNGDLAIAGIGGAAMMVTGFPGNEQRGLPFMKTEPSMSFMEKAVPVLAAAIPCSPYPVSNPAPYALLSGYAVQNGIPVYLCGSSAGHVNPWVTGNTVHVVSPPFGTAGSVDTDEGGFFHEINIIEGIIVRISLKKISGDRIYDIAEYLPDGSAVSERIIDSRRLDALRSGKPFDSKFDRSVNIPELRLFRDIRNFFKIHQTAETERKVAILADAVESLGDEYSDVALDLVGSTNLGIAQSMSDVDMVMYIRGEGDTCREDGETCDRFEEVERRIRVLVGDSCDFEVIDRVNLDLVEESILAGDCESPVLQRFVVYRGMCRPVNYRVLAPLEDLLNADRTLRTEAEKSMSEYLQVFGTTKDTNRSFDKYQARLKTMGVEIPPVLADKIRAFLQK